MSFSVVLSIALGGSVGALARHVIGTSINTALATGFPFGTLAVNLLGSFIMGIVAELVTGVWQPSAELRLMIMVGFLGALTTFSSYALDFARLMEAGEVVPALAYVLLSNLLCFLGLFLGFYLIRLVAY